MTIASRDTSYSSILHACHGVTFFGEFAIVSDLPSHSLTEVACPHRGSSYLSMSHFSSSVQELLGLSNPLPRSLADELRLGHRPLLTIDENFRELASELQVWTFYETEDSQLSGLGIGGRKDVHFSAPLVAIRSAILNVRHEKVNNLQSCHAKCASFGQKNIQTMKLYIKDLGNAIRKADQISSSTTHHPLRLENKVKIEVHGFYEDWMTAPTGEGTIRAWSKRLTLEDFFKKGPDKCLAERLEEAGPVPLEKQFISRRSRATSLFATHHSRPPSPALRPPSQNLLKKPDDDDDCSPTSSVKNFQDVSEQEPATPTSTFPPDIVLTNPSNQNRTPAPTSSTKPVIQATSTRNMRERSGLHPDHAANSFTRPLTLRSTSDSSITLFSEPSALGSLMAPSPTMPRSQSEQVVPRDRLGSIAELDSTSFSYSRRGNEWALPQSLPTGFGKPDPNSRKFVWIHLPYNNPTWVKVS